MLSVLIADDHDKMRRMLKSLLEEVASVVWESSDGEDAVAAYIAHRPDLVVMDIEMKPLDGITATRRIKAVDGAARIIIVTNYDQPELREAAQTAGACGYVLKDNLLELVQLIKHDIPRS